MKVSIFHLICMSIISFCLGINLQREFYITSLLIFLGLIIVSIGVCEE